MSQPTPQLPSFLQPVLNEGLYVFVSLSEGSDLESPEAVALIRESEGTTAVVREEIARKHGWPIRFRAAWITLGLNSDLNAIGLTAAFSSALAKAEIGCNIIAGVHHDHLFVPIERAEEAMEVLRQLSPASHG